MEDLIDSDGIQKIRDSHIGPITLQVSLPPEFQIQNQRLQTNKSTKFFIQVRDKEKKTTAFLEGEAFEKLHKVIQNNDLLLIQKYEVFVYKDDKKTAIKIISAEIIQTQTNKENSQSNPSSESNDLVLRPNQMSNNEYEQGLKITDMIQSQISQNYSLKTPSKFSNFSSSPKGTSLLSTPVKREDEKQSPFLKDSTTFQRKGDTVRSALFPEENMMEKSPQKRYPNFKPSPRQKTGEDDDDDDYTPIKDLRPTTRNWVIKARVDYKSEKRTFSKNDYTTNTLFSINLVDKDGVDISATFFDTKVVDKHFDEIEIGQVYLISGGYVKESNKRFVKSKNDFQIIFSSKSDFSFMKVKKSETSAYPEYLLTKIQDIQNKSEESLGDFVGIVVNIGKIDHMRFSDGRTAVIRKIEIIDESLKTVEVTLWGAKAAIQIELHKTIMICSARVKAYAGVKSLTLPNFGQVIAKNLPSLQYITELEEWYENKNHQQLIQSVSKKIFKDATRPISEIEAEEIDEENLFWIQASVTYVLLSKLLYPACPECQKELESRDGGWQCKKCEKAIVTPLKKSMLKIHLADSTGSLPAIAFDQVATKLVGINKDDMWDFKNLPHLESRVLSEFKGKEWKLQMKYIGMFQGSKSYRIQKIEELDYLKECQDMLAKLSAYETVAPKTINNLYDIFCAYFNRDSSLSRMN